MAAFFTDALLGDLVEFLAYTAWLATTFLFIYAIVRIVRLERSGSSIGARLTTFLGLDAIIAGCAAFDGACCEFWRLYGIFHHINAIRYWCGSHFGFREEGTLLARAAFHVLVDGTNTIGTIIVAVVILRDGRRLSACNQSGRNQKSSDREFHDVVSVRVVQPLK
jgi:hypothetical protein